MDTRIIDIDDNTICVGEQDFNNYKYTFYVKSTFMTVDHELTKADIIRWWNSGTRLTSKAKDVLYRNPWVRNDEGTLVKDSKIAREEPDVESMILGSSIDGYRKDDDNFVADNLNDVLKSEIALSDISSLTVADRVISKGLMNLEGEELKKFINKLSKSNGTLALAIIKERLPRINDTLALIPQGTPEYRLHTKTKEILIRFLIMISAQGVKVPDDIITPDDLAMLPVKFRTMWSNVKSTY